MEYKTGLWKKQSEKGTTYFNGKIKIGEQDYRITLFKNNKQKETQPDLNIIIKKYTPKEQPNKADISVFEEFGEQVSIDDYLE